MKTLLPYRPCRSCSAGYRFTLVNGVAFFAGCALGVATIAATPPEDAQNTESPDRIRNPSRQLPTTMNTKVYVRNLDAGMTESALRGLFAVYGNAGEVNLPLRRGSGQSSGFAFVTMATPEGARSAIHALNGMSVGSGTIEVSEARPHEGRGVRARGW